MVVPIDTSRISDWDTFHAVFADAFGFPGFYGRNMDAWIDCMTYLDDPAAELSEIHVSPGEVVTINLQESGDFSMRCPQLLQKLVECAEFVNQRRADCGEPRLLEISLH